MFDVFYQELVLVIAPLSLIVYDNPRASELLNHLGSTALKYCCICMVSYTFIVRTLIGTLVTFMFTCLFFFRRLELKIQTL